QLRRMAEGAKDNVQREFGDDFKDLDWQKLDPSQYDPRRIVREALVEEDTAIRESKRRERSSNESAPTSGDGGESDSFADASAAAKMREQSPIERLQAQAELRDRSTGAPFDPEAT